MFRNLPRFDYFDPQTLNEALSLLAQYGPEAKVLAGGTDLIPQMRWGEVKPGYVVGLHRIEELREIKYEDGQGLRLGSMTRISEIERSDVIRKHYPLLNKSALVLGSAEIRNKATVGGNLCTAAPSADMAPSLLVLGAQAVISSKGGEKRVPLEEFFTGPKKTILDKGEILVRLEIPPPEPLSAGEYIKLGRRNAMEIAIISVAAFLTLEPDRKTSKRARVALGTAAPTPIRAKEAEKILSGQGLDEEIIVKAAEAASMESSPRTSWRTTEEYRREMIRVLSRRAIKQAIQNIAG